MPGERQLSVWAALGLWAAAVAAAAVYGAWHGYGGRAYAVTLCVPLCDVDEANGPTAVWPGSHRTALRARPPGESEILREYPAEHMAGDFGRSFLFDFRTFHCGLPNLTREPRPLLMFVFTRSWYRDPNLADVFPSVVITKRNLERIPDRYRYLFMLAPAARRSLWKNKKKW